MATSVTGVAVIGSGSVCNLLGVVHLDPWIRELYPAAL